MIICWKCNFASVIPRARQTSQPVSGLFLSLPLIHSFGMGQPFFREILLLFQKMKKKLFFFGSVLFKMTFHFNHNSVWWLSRHRCCFSSCTGYRFALNQLTFISTVYFKYFAIVCNIQQPNSIIPFENLAAAHYPRDVNKQLCWMILLNLTIPFWKTIILCFFLFVDEKSGFFLTQFSTFIHPIFVISSFYQFSTSLNYWRLNINKCERWIASRGFYVCVFFVHIFSIFHVCSMTSLKQ